MGNHFGSGRRSFLVQVTVPLVAVGLFFASCRGKTNSSGASVPSPSPGECANAYYPVAPDLKLDYQTTLSGGLPPYTFTVTFSDIDEDSFVRHERSSTGEAIDSDWKCQFDGLTSAVYGGMAAPQPRLKLNTEKSGGVKIPSARLWQKGTKWTYDFQVTGEMMLGGAPGPVELYGSVTVTNEITGSEKISVFAGTFDTLKVVSKTIERLTLKGGQSLPSEIVFTTDLWFAKDVGLVKAESNDLKVSTSLTSISHGAETEADDDDSSS